MDEYQSWGRYPRVVHRVHRLQWISKDLALPQEGTLLPYGQGRTYGDGCLNDGGTILATEDLSRFISFDTTSGVLRCEAGVTIAEILQYSVPRGWFIPVTPGTKFVSIGGAIGNDVHGKNHHSAGTFGRHVLAFELLRSDGSRHLCSPSQNRELFEATIGGLGLTGLILWADIQMKPVKNAFIDMESIKFGGLDEFFEVSGDSDKRFEYTVAWLDCIASGNSFGRGIFMRGNHAGGDEALPRLRTKPVLSVPMDFPSFALNNLTVRAFNTLYYHKQFAKSSRVIVHHDPFFYPLDSVLDWNRIYGKQGFLQFQCVVPRGEGHTPIRKVLRAVVDSGAASFLAVLKEFGDIPSPGIMSFPRKGVTLCLDFAFRGERTLTLFRKLEALTREFGGAMYPAKDACMSPETFRACYPRWEEFARHIDPRFSSSFWRRMTK